MLVVFLLICLIVLDHVGAPECVKIKPPLHVWSNFLLQAGYLDFGRVCRSGVEHVRR